MPSHRNLLVRIGILLAVAAILLIVLIQGTKGDFFMFGSNDMQTVLDERFSMEGIGEITLDALSLNVEVIATDEADIRVVLESNMPSEHRAQIAVERKGSNFLVEQLQKIRIGIFLMTREKLTLYLPAEYADTLTLRTRSGNLTMGGSRHLRSLSLWLTSGNMEIGDVACDTYALQSSSGNVTLGNLSGSGSLKMTSGNLRIASLSGDQHEVRSTSGTLRIGSLLGAVDVSLASGTTHIESFEGQGRFHSSSGTIRIGLERMTGDLSLDCTSGSIRMTVDEKSSFYFEGRAISGSIKTDFASQKDGRRTAAAVGNNPAYTLSCQTTSGSIRLAY